MSHQWETDWECPLCHQRRREDGFDPCIPALPGVKFACCGHGGHGQNEGYIYFENGVRIGFVATSICYDDDRPSVIVPGPGCGDDVGNAPDSSNRTPRD